MRYRFLAPAAAELEEAIEFYNQQRDNLGDEFAEEVERTISTILEFPEAWPVVSSRTRRCQTRRFPYGVVYQIRGDELLIVAVMHLKRRPVYWKDRSR